MNNAKVITHPLLLHSLTALRNQDTAAAAFRRHADTVAHTLVLNATQSLETKPVDIQTPVAETRGFDLTETIVAIPILRAGLAMLPSVQQLIPHVQVGFIGLERDEKTAVAHQYYNKIPKDLEHSRVLVLDPMLATGGTMEDTISEAKNSGASQITAVCIVCAPEGLERIGKVHPDVTVYTAAIDDRLNEQKYIVPGLGDFGDRYFDTL